jgi:hypothetical protein
MFWDAEHPDTLYSMSFLVAILEAERQYAGAEKLEREGWRLRAIGQAARAPGCARIVGRYHLHEGRYDEAQ